MRCKDTAFYSFMQVFSKKNRKKVKIVTFLYDFHKL